MFESNQNEQLSLIPNADAEPEVINPPAPETDIDALIVIEQLPVITERLEQMSAEVTARTAAVMGAEVTEETLKQAKSLRAELNKEFDRFEELRKQIKKTILEPYENLERIYKINIGDKYTQAKADLGSKISAVEHEIKKRKIAEIYDYFNEYALSLNVQDYADFESFIGAFTTSQSVKKFKELAKDHLDVVASELKAIEIQPEDVRGEILAEYKNVRSATEAMRIVADRRRAIAEQERIRAERERQEQVYAEAERRVQEHLPPPQVQPPAVQPTEQDDPVLSVRFTVTAPHSRLKQLKQYLIDGGYSFE